MRRITDLILVRREVMLAEVDWDWAQLPAGVTLENHCRVGSRAYLD